MTKTNIGKLGLKWLQDKTSTEEIAIISANRGAILIVDSQEAQDKSARKAGRQKPVQETP